MLKIIYGLLHYFPELFDDAEGQVYLEVFTRQLAACAAIGSYEGNLLAAPATDKQIKSARQGTPTTLPSAHSYFNYGS